RLASVIPLRIGSKVVTVLLRSATPSPLLLRLAIANLLRLASLPHAKIITRQHWSNKGQSNNCALGGGMDSELVIKINAIYQASRRALNHRIEQGWALGNRLTSNYLLYFVQAIRNFITIGQNEAGGFAYWALFSLFPLIVLSIIIAITLLGTTRNTAR